MKFADRREAGARLGLEVAAHHPDAPLVTALPRGGVPVGFEVAGALNCEMDILAVRKVGVPFHPELAMGAVAEGDVVIRNQEIIDAVGIDEETFLARAEAEKTELERRLALYRESVPAIDPSGRTAVVVDDGLATGSTALAAIRVLRAREAFGVWLAVPVAPADAVPIMEKAADRVIVVDHPKRFMAVGAWYRDFTPTPDDQVVELLRQSRN